MRGEGQPLEELDPGHRVHNSYVRRRAIQRMLLWVEEPENLLRILRADWNRPQTLEACRAKDGPRRVPGSLLMADRRSLFVIHLQELFYAALGFDLWLQESKRGRIGCRELRARAMTAYAALHIYHLNPSIVTWAMCLPSVEAARSLAIRFRQDLQAETDQRKKRWWWDQMFRLIESACEMTPAQVRGWFLTPSHTQATIVVRDDQHLEEVVDLLHRRIDDLLLGVRPGARISLSLRVSLSLGQEATSGDRATDPPTRKRPAKPAKTEGREERRWEDDDSLFWD
ncbi:MAG: hypothetical protein D6812_07505 [Deltaproteobacteria bacterium]|nr:MAG: hypothetical protein D6812_07505 [Deltaproteobacteria bacterium]